MGKHKRRKPSDIAFDNHPGCMWGVLNILDNHHWKNVKKMLPHKRHGSGRHAAGKTQEHIDAEIDHCDIEKEMTDSSRGTKSSGKARIKSLIADDMSQKKGQRHQRQLTRTDSIHHNLESSDEDALAEILLNIDSPRIPHQENENSTATCTPGPLQPNASEEPVTSKKKCEVCSTLLTVNHLGHSQVDDEHGKQQVENHTLLPEKLDKAKQALLEQKLIYVTEHTKDAPLYQSKEFSDALNIVNLNKELFLKILLDQGSPSAHHAHNRQAFSTKKGSAKSESFPVAGVSGETPSGPSKFEIGSHAKGEGKLRVGSQAQKSAEFESAEDISELSMPLMAENMVNGNSKPNQANPETADNSSTGSSLQMKNGSQNQVVIKRFKDLKQKLKHAIRESRKERHRINMDAFFHKIPYGRKFSKEVKEIADQWKEPTMDRVGKYSPASSYESDLSGPVFSKGRPRHIRRLSSLSSSLDRYRQLYESSFNREATYHISERLKLREKEVGLPGGSAPKSLGRLLSLPNLKSYFYLQSEDSSVSGTPIRTFVGNKISIGSSFDERKSLEFLIGSENRMQLDVLVESGSQENLAEISELNPVIGGQMGSASVANGEDKASHHQQKIGSINRLTSKLAEPSPISVIDSSFQEDITSPSKFSISEDSELKPRNLLFDGLESLADGHYEFSMDSPAVAESRVDLEKVELPSRYLDSYSLHVQVDTKDKAEFNYVRDVLELSGFTRNELLGAWHSADQPLDPSMYEEMEEEFSENEEGGYCDNHLVLFDLINEVLMDIYERSFAYYPMPLCSFSHIRPMPVGYHVLEEVWTYISWYLSSRPELDRSLDYVVSRDLAKGDRWMNLQFDTECVGIELEDLIFDDLLKEVIWT